MTFLFGFQSIPSGKILRGAIPVWRVALVLALAAGSVMGAAATNDTASRDCSALVADRIAIERVYYRHRLGDKPPFEELLPRTMAEQLVKRDWDKESTLKKVYGVEITAGEIETEITRINHSTRAPDVLAELKEALENDPVRFGCSVAKPILVEKRLRGRFENDTSLHTAGREQAGQLRARILTASQQHSAGLTELMEILRSAGNPSEITWQLEAEEQALDPSKLTPAAPVPHLAAASNSNDSAGADVRMAQAPSAPKPLRETLPFRELRPELQALLRTQLQKPGDISAVVETQAGFWLFLARERSRSVLSVASVCIPKQNYELWLDRQIPPAATP